MDEPTRFVAAPDLVPNALYDEALVPPQADRTGDQRPVRRQAGRAGRPFTLDDLEHALAERPAAQPAARATVEPIAPPWCTLAKANYEIRFGAELDVSERIIFPSSPTETNGIEDARFVRFTHDDGRVCYYATYTAYDGRVILPPDARDRGLPPLQGEHPERAGGPEQGVRPLPREVNGQYAMLSRQDNENIYLMYSDMPTSGTARS